MKYLIAAVALMLGIAMSSLGTVSSAYADEYCNPKSAGACVEAGKAANRPASTNRSGELADTCIRALTYGRTEMILVAGPDVDGPVLETLPKASGHFVQIDHSGEAGEVWIGEFCFDGDLIAGLRAITICNGETPQTGYHHTLSLADESAPYFRRLLQTGQAGDFLSLLGKRKTYSQPIASVFTSQLYRKMYGG